MKTRHPRFEPSSPGDRSVETLRRHLTRLKETGYDGFEGLIAAVCTQVVGLPFRLVSAGQQFGRDAEGSYGFAAILIEAKRYDSRLSFADLSVKLVDALERSRRTVEVWAAAATVPFDAVQAGDLSKIGAKGGVAVLVLDWSPPLPLLGTLLAVGREATLEWFTANAAAALQDVEAGLLSIRSHPTYPDLAKYLKRELNPAILGWNGARSSNALYLEATFRDRKLAVLRWNQPLAPLDEGIRPAPLRRPQLEEALIDGLGQWRAEPSTLILLGPARPAQGGLEGDEGVGKTWAVARAWLAMPDTPDDPRPIFLFMASHMWHEGDEKHPKRVIARLLAAQTSDGPGVLEQWEARLDRWSMDAKPGGGGRPLLIVVLDGVNERAQLPWADLIIALSLLARTLPLRIAATTRRGIYDWDFRPRLASLAVEEIVVEAFSDVELDQVLREAGKDPVEIRRPLRDFLRNPRVLSVGLELLDRLDPEEVGVDRLLFEYMRKRQEGRPGAAHTADQLAQTLVRHAAKLRDRLLRRDGVETAGRFDEAAMTELVGLPLSQVRITHDLSDIVDSHFLRIVDPRRNRYAFTSRSLPFALGLLVADELDQASAGGHEVLSRLIEEIIDPVRAVARAPEILVGALEVALVDANVSDAVPAALLGKILALQNLPDDQRLRLFSGLRDRPCVYVVTADALYGDERGIARREWLKDAIIEARGWAEIQTSLDLAIRRWLRSWQPEPVMPDVSDYPAEQADRVLEAHRERVRRHRDDLDGLSGDERAYVSEQLVTLPMACTAAPIPVAIGLLAGMPLAGFADDLLAWCVADAIDWRSNGSRAAMQWLWRLAPDWGDLAQAVDRWTEDRLRTGASTAFRWAALGMLTAIGGFRQAGIAEAMWKSLSDEPRRTVLPSPWHVEGVDPLDPGIEDASVDTPALVIRYGELIRKEDWQPHLLMRPHSSFEEVLHLLCRFAPERAADLHREFAARAPTWDVSPTVAAAFLARDAIILAPAVDLLLSWYRQLVSQNLPAKELDAPTMLLAAILPHLRPARQFEVHGMQPSGAQDAFWLGPLTSPLPPSCLAAELANLSSAVEPARLRLALVFAAGTSAPIEALRPAACTARTSADPRLRAVGLRAMAISSDPADDADFLASGWAWSGSVGRAHAREDFWGSAWLLKSADGSDDPALLDRLEPSLRSLAIERCGPRVVRLAGERLVTAAQEARRSKLTRIGLEIKVVRSDDTAYDDGLRGSWHSMGFRAVPMEGRQPDERSSRMLDLTDYDAHVGSLPREVRECFLHPISSAALDRIAREARDVFGELVDVVEAGPVASPAFTVLAHDIARHLSFTDSARAAELFERYGSTESAVPEQMPICWVSRLPVLIWRSADTPAIRNIRERRLDEAATDDAIAAEVLAAELAGKHALLSEYVSVRFGRDEPSAIARSLTTAGFSIEDACFTAMFDDPRLSGDFLAEAASVARKAYDRARWGRYWHQLTMSAETELEAWRCAELAAAGADVRCVTWNMRGSGRLFNALLPLYRPTLARSASEASRNRRKTLFGIDAPDPDLSPSLRLNAA